MKLRQKLAVTMAATMMLTAVPVVTSAASTNHVISAGQIVEKDKKTVLPGVSIDFKNAPEDGEEFFLKLEGAEWLKVDGGYNPNTINQAITKAQNSVAETITIVNNLLTKLGARTADKLEEIQQDVNSLNTSLKDTKEATAELGITFTYTEFKVPATMDEAQELVTPLKSINSQLVLIEKALEEKSPVGTTTSAAAVVRAMSNVRAISEDAQILNINGFAGPTLPNASWSYVSNGYTIEYTRQDDTTMKITLTNAATAYDTSSKVSIPMPIKATSDEIKVSVTANGGHSVVTEGTYTIASTSTKAFSLTVATGDDLKYFYNEGELSKITLKESFLNSFQKSGKDLALRIELDNLDFEFDPNSDVEITGRMGYNFNNVDVQLYVDSDDRSTAYIIIPNSSLVSGATSLGQIDITGIRVFSNEKEIDLGELKADITAVDEMDIYAEKSTRSNFAVSNGEHIQLSNSIGAELNKEYKDVILAKVEKFGATITMKDEKAVDIIAGREEDVEFTVKENVDDVFVGQRTLTLSLKDNEEATDAEYFMLTRQQANNPELIIDEVKNNKKNNVVQKVELTFVDKDADLKAANASDANEYAKQNMVRVKEIKVTFVQTRADQSVAINKNDARDSFTVKTKIYVPVGEQDKKNIEIVGELRGEEVKSATAVNVVDPFDITFDTTTLKVGLQDQVIKTYSIKETDKEMFKKGTLEMHFVSGKKGGNGILLESAGDMTVTEGTLKKAGLGEITQGNKVDFKRQSKAAATLTFKDAKVTVDRTVPEGSYDLELSGKAIDKYDGTYSVSKFLNIGTQNTQDIQAANGLARVEATFTIGSNTYTVDGVEREMVGATPYIQDGGYTMIPVRYVAEALGVKGQNILADKGVITIFAGNRTVQLTNGSKTAIVNGAKIELGTKVVIKEGRTYVPVGELGRILGVTTLWDNTTKTATFKN